MISAVFLELWAALAVFVTAILVHETAHYLTAKRLGYHAEITWSGAGKRGFLIETHYSGPWIPAYDELGILFAGLIWGLLPIFAFWAFAQPSIWSVAWLFFAYAYVSAWDLKRCAQVLKEKEGYR